MALQASMAWATDPYPLHADETPPNRVDTIREGMTTRVQTLAENLDEFLSDREYENERNDTEVRLRFDFDVSSDQSTSLKFSPRIRLRLPNTERIFLLDLGGGARDEGGTGVGPEGFFPDREDRNEGAAIRLRNPNQLGAVRVTPESGIGFVNAEPTLFVGIRFSRFWDLNENTLVFASQRFRAHTDRGAESVSYVRLDRKFPQQLLVRGEVRLAFREDRDGARLRPGVIVRRPVSDKAVLSWENYVTFASSPELRTRKVFSGLRYRRLLYRDWLFGEVAPWVGGQEKRGELEFFYGVLLRIDIDF